MRLDRARARGDCRDEGEEEEARARGANARLAEIGRGHANHSFNPRLRGRSLRGSGRFSRREINDCLVMPPETAGN